MAEGGRYRSRRDTKTFNIAVIGKVKSGKSSLIRALLQAQFQLGPDDTLPATDALECTRTCSKYEYGDSRVALWDVPGCGTQNEPLALYEKRIEIDKYDGFIICCGGPVTENEICLHNLIAQKRRRYIFVRTKIDIALENERKAHPVSFDVRESLSKIRENFEKNLPDCGVPLFLVSSCLEFTDYTEDFLNLQFMVFDRGSLYKFMTNSNRRVDKHEH